MIFNLNFVETKMENKEYKITKIYSNEIIEKNIKYDLEQAEIDAIVQEAIDEDYDVSIELIDQTGLHILIIGYNSISQETYTD